MNIFNIENLLRRDPVTGKTFVNIAEIRHARNQALTVERSY
jgi:hypothetical protein